MTSLVASATAFPAGFNALLQPSGADTEPGSTTTPRVLWQRDLPACCVLQLSQFGVLHFNGTNSTPMTENFRPVQPLNGRKVLWSGAGIALPTAKLLLLPLALTCTLSSLCH